MKKVSKKKKQRLYALLVDDSAYGELRKGNRASGMIK